MSDIKAKKVGCIVAVTQDNYIGYENDLMIQAMIRRMQDPEKIVAKEVVKADMNHFKFVTTPPQRTSAIIMGRRTWESLPKKPLPGRVNVVITSDEAYKVPEGVHVFTSIDEALESVEVDEAWLIGGAGIYDEARYYAHEVRICRFEFSASTVFDPSELKHNGVMASEWMKNPEDHGYYLDSTLRLTGESRYYFDLYRYKEPD